MKRKWNRSTISTQRRFPKAARTFPRRSISRFNQLAKVPPEIDARLSRTAIDRYEWPLGAVILALTMSILIRERKRVRARARLPRWSKLAVPATALLLIFARPAFGTANTGLNLYRDGKYNDA